MLFQRLTLLLCTALLVGASPSLSQAPSTDIAEREYGEALRYDAGAGLTASGEPYNPERLTVAHASLPFGTLVEINFRRRSVTARVNDRNTGDGLVRLSARTADQLGLPPSGGRVEVRLDPGEVAFLREQAARRAAAPQQDAPVATTSSSSQVWDRFTVQLGSFSDEGRAREHAGRQRGTWVQAVTLGGDTVYRVYYGIYPTRDAADRALEEMRAEGVHGFIQGLSGDVSQGEDRSPVVSMRHSGGQVDHPTAEEPLLESIASASKVGRPSVRGW